MKKGSVADASVRTFNTPQSRHAGEALPGRQPSKSAGRPAEALPGRGPSKPSGSPADRIRSLQAVAVQLAGALTLDRITGLVAQAGTTTLDADILLIALYGETDRQLRVVHETGLPAAARPYLAATLAAASSVLAGQEHVEQASVDSVAEALVGSRRGETARSSPRHRALAVLIPPRGPARGILAVGRTHTRAFSEEDRAFLDVLAAISGAALERLRLSSGWSGPRHEMRHRQLAVQFDGSHVHVGDMEIGLEDQDVVIGARRARLTPSEFRLLLFLASEPGRVRTRREILQHLWHTDHVGDERACDAHVSNLRRKIERDPSRPERVVTLRGVGYVLQFPRKPRTHARTEDAADAEEPNGRSTR